MARRAQYMELVFSHRIDILSDRFFDGTFASIALVTELRRVYGDNGQDVATSCCFSLIRSGFTYLVIHLVAVILGVGASEQTSLSSSSGQSFLPFFFSSGLSLECGNSCRETKELAILT